MLIDSNLIIYATQPAYIKLHRWLIKNASHYSAITRLETLGYPRLQEVEKQAIATILDSLEMLMMTEATLEIAINLRQQRKMSVGDVLIAATCLEHNLPLATANHIDFEKIADLTIYNPLNDMTV
jgi:predicted nucleic acid-binding protein